MTTYTRIATNEAKNQFNELIDRVAVQKEKIVLMRRGQDILAMIPIEDLQLLQATENQEDLATAIETLREARESGTVPLDGFQANTD